MQVRGANTPDFKSSPGRTADVRFASHERMLTDGFDAQPSEWLPGGQLVTKE